MLLVALLFLLDACASAVPTQAPAAAPTKAAVEAPAAAQPTQAPAPTSAPAVVVTQVVEKKQEIVVQPTVTRAPASKPTGLATETQQKPLPSPTSIAPSPTPSVEERLVEMEWPQRMRLGESDIVRLSLIPSEEGYIVSTEFEDHKTVTQTLQVAHPAGYDLFAAARLDGVGFNIAPNAEEELFVQSGEPLTWRWSLTPRQPGRQRLSLILKLRWKLADDPKTIVRETVAYSKGLDIPVSSFLGLTQAQAMSTGWFGMLLGGLSILVLLLIRPRRFETKTAGNLVFKSPNTSLSIEPNAGVRISEIERTLLQSLFQTYRRLIIQEEFLSGYSGARTFLVLPIRQDGKADAYTIAKVGDRKAIEIEFNNYELFVKDTLPPITARIQHPPVCPTTKSGSTSKGKQPASEYAAIQYTFIGEPGHSPVSLREVLLKDPKPELLKKLFNSFGPNWWMQRNPYTFSLAAEYDRMLTTHLVIEPYSANGKNLDGRIPPSRVQFVAGETVRLNHFKVAERRADGKSLSLLGEAAAGEPALRVRWLGLSQPNQATGRVVATRQTLLKEFVSGFDLLDLSDPIDRLPGLLAETVTGTRSIIHGDLNLENILVGPGGLVWLIDFARTREGHTLIDFAHLEAELISQILAERIRKPEDYRALLSLLMQGIQEPAFDQINVDYQVSFDIQTILPLMDAIHTIARQCLFNPSEPREYCLALVMACMGALKFTNLSRHAKHLLYLTGAYLAENL